MKALKKVLIVVGIVLLALVVLSQFLPSTYHVERSITISAKADAVFPWVNRLQKWPEWSPWTAAKDPSIAYSYQGPEEGVDAVSRWDSKKWGDGFMKITEADPAKGVKFEISSLKGKYTSIAALNFEPTGDSTKVTWVWDGKVSRDPIDRYFSLLMNKWLGKDFEEGLKNLKAKAEAQ